MNIQDKVVVITGGASGLGYATACAAQQAGARVAILDAQADRLKEIEKGLGFIGYVVDVADADAVKAALDTIQTELGPIRSCVNCAGIVQGARVVGREGPMPLSDFERVIRVNLVGTFNVIRCVSVLMSQNAVETDDERGVIINTSSVAAYEGQLGQAAYSASKGGVAAMTLPIARELSQFGVRVMTIAPGIMETPMMAGMTDAVRSALHASVPFPKRMGQATEFADLALHIMSNVYLNGSVIRLDGGIRLNDK